MRTTGTTRAMTEQPGTRDLSTLREDIARVDRGLLELLRRRMELAAEVGRLKAGAGMPVTVRDVEERVIARARRHAPVCGISEGVLEDVFRAILRASVERQHREGMALRELRGERILLIGGAGGMGTWMRRFLELGGHTVDLLDPAFARLDDVPDLDAYAALLVAVPLDRTPDVIRNLAERKPRGLVIEIASIKDHL